MCEIRPVNDTGSGSGRVVFPKDQLRELGLVGDDGSIDGHLMFDQDDDGRVIVDAVQ